MSDGRSAVLRRWLRQPEWLFGVFLFFLHFAWEMLQTPFFVGMPEMAHWPATLFCLRATLGDVAIGIAAFWAAALVRRDRWWFLGFQRREWVVYIGAGLLATMVFEGVSVAYGRWSYSPLMPVVPLIQVGLVPLLQWVVVPVAAALLLRGQYSGARG